MNPTSCINRGEIVISLHSLVLADRIKLYYAAIEFRTLRTKTTDCFILLIQEYLTFTAELTLLGK